MTHTAAMPCSHLLHVAAAVVERAPMIIEWPHFAASVNARVNAQVSAEAGAGVSAAPCVTDLMTCWSAMHDRQRAWARRIVMTEAPIMSDAPELSKFVVELFLSEPLSRLWVAIIACQQQRHGLNAMASIYRSALEREDQLRQRAVGAVLAGRSMPLETSLQLHRIRRYSHRAAELLIEALAARYPAAERFSFHPAAIPPRRELPQTHWWSSAAKAAVPLRLLAQSLTSASISRDAACSAESARVVYAALKCLPPVSLHGSDVQIGAANLAAYTGRDGGEATSCLPWTPLKPRRTSNSDLALRRR